MIMSTLLRIDASSRIDGSHSRAIGDHLERRLRAELAGAWVMPRDLAKTPLEHIRNATIAAMFGAAKKRWFGKDPAIRMSDEIIAEVRDADAILLTTPIYNFGIPSALKAWIDQLVRINETFSYDGANFKGLLASKPVFVVIAYGASGYTNGPLKPADFVRPYLQFVLGFIGLTNVTVIAIEGTSGSAEAVAAALAAARADVDQRFGATASPMMKAA